MSGATFEGPWKLPKFAIDIFLEREYTYNLLKCVYYIQGYCTQV
jgi:hypothetical protein